jgi:3-methyl-2-oxobutanoate hydroxymethyltransferase
MLRSTEGSKGGVMASRRRKTTRELVNQFRRGEKISMVTCYDYTFARLVEQSNIDAILVGDSLGNVIQGHDTPLPVTIADIIYHTQAVIRGNRSAHVIADMPFMSYQGSDEDGLRNAGRLMKEGGAQAVKVEGGEALCPMIRRMVSAGMPVVGHLGLTPQSVHAVGGYRLQGTTQPESSRLLADARALQEAGVYLLVLEMIPRELAAQVTEELDIPTIGIGAGPDTGGQVLVLYDLLGMNLEFQPKFLKRYQRLEESIVDALKDYVSEVRDGAFPGPDHSF